MTALLRIIITCIAYVPQNISDKLASSLAWLVYLFDQKGKKILFSNVAAIYALPAHSAFAKLFARQVYRSQVISAFDSIRALIRPESIVLQGLDDYMKAVRSTQENQAIVACTAHLGAWELAGYCCARASEHGFVALAKRQRWSAATKLLDWLRLKFCSQVLLVEKTSIIKDVLQALQRGDIVGFVADQKPMARQGIDVQFLGQNTGFVSGPAKFAAKTTAALVCIYVVRVGPGAYQVIYDIKQKIDYGCDDVQRESTQWIADSMNKVIRLYPEQWAWTYKRWKTL